MATRTTTTKSKTKTAKSAKVAIKKPASANASATRKKPTTKPTTKKTEVKAAVVNKSTTARTNPLKKLRNAQFVSAIILAIFAVLAGVLMNSDSYQTTVGYTAKDDLASQTTTAFAPAIQAVADVEVRWALVTILAVSALFCLSYATVLRKQYAKAVEDNIRPMRWVEIGVTFALMFELVALMSGVQNLLTLKLVGGLLLLFAGMAWMAERHNKVVATKPHWAAFSLSTFAVLLPVLLITGYALLTWLYGMVRFPWYVYGLHAVLLLGIVLLLTNQVRYFKRHKKWANYVQVEKGYIYTNVLTKALFAIVLILGLPSVV